MFWQLTMYTCSLVNRIFLFIFQESKHTSNTHTQTVNYFEYLWIGGNNFLFLTKLIDNFFLNVNRWKPQNERRMMMNSKNPKLWARLWATCCYRIGCECSTEWISFRRMSLAAHTKAVRTPCRITSSVLCSYTSIVAWKNGSRIDSSFIIRFGNGGGGGGGDNAHMPYVYTVTDAFRLIANRNVKPI